MSEKEQLWYLIDGLLAGSYDANIFCDEFIRIYNFKVDYASLSQKERQAFGEMRGMAARFSDNEEELKIPHMYFSKEELLIKARDIQQTIKRSC